MKIKVRYLSEDKIEKEKHPLRPGLSTVTAIDIRDTGQPPNAALTQVSTKEYETNLYSDVGANGNAQADQIIDDNLFPKGNVVEPACLASQAARLCWYSRSGRSRLAPKSKRTRPRLPVCQVMLLKKLC